MFAQIVDIVKPLLAVSSPGCVLSIPLLAQFNITAEAVGVMLGLIGIMGSILMVYVRNETRAAVQAKEIEDLQSDGRNDTLQFEKLQQSIDSLRLTVERLITLEEVRSGLRVSQPLPHRTHTGPDNQG